MHQSTDSLDQMLLTPLPYRKRICHLMQKKPPWKVRVTRNDSRRKFTSAPHPRRKRYAMPPLGYRASSPRCSMSYRRSRRMAVHSRMGRKLPSTQRPRTKNQLILICIHCSNELRYYYTQNSFPPV